jgi:hypothetical protein
VLQLYSFDYGYSLVVLGKDFLSWSGGEGKRIIYNMIANSLRKIHFSENREQNNCSEIAMQRCKLM